jgi:hypothetical protein
MAHISHIPSSGSCTMPAAHTTCCSPYHPGLAPAPTLTCTGFLWPAPRWSCTAPLASWGRARNLLGIGVESSAASQGPPGDADIANRLWRYARGYPHNYPVPALAQIFNGTRVFEDGPLTSPDGTRYHSDSWYPVFIRRRRTACNFPAQRTLRT